jgi:23S rRNA (guanosine2251-2'-O)-methyltransferase
MKTITVFGIRSIIETIKSGKSIDKVWLLKGVKSNLSEQLLHTLRSNNISFSYVPVERLNRFSEKNHQGAVARIAAFQTHQMEHVIEDITTNKKNPVFLLLDGITDTRNFGAILRSAAAIDIDAVFIPTSGSAPLNGDVIKTSVGGAFKVPISKVANLKDVIYILNSHDIPTIAINEKAKTTVYECDLKGPVGLIFGSEDKGISSGLLKIIDKTAKLPMSESIESLNVSVACGVTFYELIRQRLIS